MIKLKDILNESKKELHKVTTMKDDNPFMTEEQWQQKWLEKTKLITEADEKKAKTVIKKNISPLKRALAQYLSREAMGFGHKLPASQVKSIFAKYLKTGTISKSDAEKIYLDVRGFIWSTGTLGIVASAMLATMSFTTFLILPIAYAVMGYLTSFGSILSQFYPKGISSAEIKKYDDLAKKRYMQASRKAGFFKGILDKISGELKK